MFQHRGRDLTVFEDVIAVVKLRALQRRATDGQRRAIGAILGQLFDPGNRGLVKRRFHHQVLRVVAGDEHLGQRHHLGARRRAPAAQARRARAALPSRSPTVGLSCASVRRNLSAIMGALFIRLLSVM